MRWYSSKNKREREREREREMQEFRCVLGQLDECGECGAQVSERVRSDRSTFPSFSFLCSPSPFLSLPVSAAALFPQQHV